MATPAQSARQEVAPLDLHEVGDEDADDERRPRGLRAGRSGSWRA